MPKPRVTRFNDFHLDFTPMARKRRSLFMSQRQLGEAIGRHPVTINRIERNRQVPQVDTLIAAVQAMGYPADQLVSAMFEMFEVKGKS